MDKSDYRILMFAPHAYPAMGAESLTMNKFMLAMIQRNINMDTLTWERGPSAYTDSSAIWSPLRKVVMPIQVSEKFHYINPLKHLINVPALTNLVAGIQWSSSAVRIGQRYERKKEYDLILSKCLPLWGHLPAYILARQFSLPWIACWNDPHLGRIMPPPYGRGDKKSSYLVERFMSAVGKQADWHVFPCERLRSFMMQFLPVKTYEKSSVIPHVALSQFKANDEVSRSVFSICHTGTLDEARNPETFFQGIKRFISNTRCNNISITFLGEISRTCRDLIQEYDLGQITEAHKWSSFENVLRVQASSSVLLIIEAPVAEGIFLPSKFIDYIQSGRPILAVSPKSGTLNDILTKYGGGIAADVTSSESIANAIEKLYWHWRSNTLEQTFSSDILYPIFSEEHISGQYLELFEQVITGKAKKVYE